MTEHAPLPKRVTQAGLIAGVDPAMYEPNVPYPLAAVPGEDSMRPGSVLKTVGLHQVKRRLVSWMWPGHIPTGMITIIGGYPGVAKSFLSLDLVARVSRGDNMPDGSPGFGRPEVALVVSMEDPLEEAIAPRLDAAGADENYIEIIDMSSDWTANRAADLERTIESTGARFVMLDPWLALVGVEEVNRAEVTRNLMRGLMAAVERTRCAFLIDTHFKKGSEDNPLNMLASSSQLGAAARSVFIAERDFACEHEVRYALAGIKHNVCATPLTITYRVVDSGLEGNPQIGKVIWGEEITTSAEQLLHARSEVARGGHAGGEKLHETKAFILASIPRSSHDLDDMAHSAGISNVTLRRAKAELKEQRMIRYRKEGVDGEWWVFPAAPADGEKRQEQYKENQKLSTYLDPIGMRGERVVAPQHVSGVFDKTHERVVAPQHVSPRSSLERLGMEKSMSTNERVETVVVPQRVPSDRLQKLLETEGCAPEKESP